MSMASRTSLSSPVCSWHSLVKTGDHCSRSSPVTCHKVEAQLNHPVQARNEERDCLSTISFSGFFSLMDFHLFSSGVSYFLLCVKKRDKLHGRREGFLHSLCVCIRRTSLFFSSSRAKLPFCVSVCQCVHGRVCRLSQCASFFCASLAPATERAGKASPTLSPGFTFHSSFLLSLPVPLFRSLSG